MNLDNEKSGKGKFFGYLICTDCDGTLTYDIGKVSEKNVRAIKYFQSEGGLFTLATGRFLIIWKCLKDNLKSMPLWLL